MITRLQRKAAAQPDRQLILLITMGIPVLMILLFSYVYFTVALKTDFDRIPTQARGQIVMHKTLNCFAENETIIVIDTSKVTDQKLNSCYPVDDTEKILYPFRVSFVWTEGIVEKNVTATSSNFIYSYTRSVDFPIIIKDNNKEHLAKAVFDFYEVT